MVKRRKSVRDFKDGLRKRTEESYKARDTFRRGIFKEQLPDDIVFWSCKEGEHLIDIIPYLAGPNDPITKEGEPTYVLDIKVHQNVGPSEGVDFVCLAENFGRPCPICEHRKQLRSEGAEDELWKALYPKRRCIYNIICYDSAEEEEKGIQVWEVAWWFTERLFVELAKGPTVGRHRRGGDDLGFIPFADPDEGRSIAFTRQGSGAQNTSYLGHRFVERDYIIEDEILEKAWVLDELIYVPTYDEVYDAYWGGESFKEAEPEVENEKEDEIPESRPSHRLRGRLVQNKEKEEEKEEEKIEDDIPEPSVEVSKSDDEVPESDGNKCPGRGRFGIDTDMLDACEQCTVWEACVDEYERLQKEREERRSRRRRR